MWLRRKDYDRAMLLVDELTKQLNLAGALREDLLRRHYTAEERLQQQARQLGEMTSTLDWLRIRVNGLERERAALLLAQGVQVAVPTMEPRREPREPEAGLTNFEDAGDDAGLPITDALELP